MKRFFLLVYICLSCLIAQAQAVTDGVFVSGDIVSFSYDSDPWVQYDFRLYLEASSGGVRAPRVISDDCCGGCVLIRMVRLTIIVFRI